MIISKQADYAVRTIIDLAERHPEIVAIKDISARQDIPKPFLNKIIQTLSKAGLVETLRGAQGGVRLWTEPFQITLRQIVETVDGPISINRCLMAGGNCARKPACAAHRVFAKAKSAFLDELEGTTVDMLLKEQEKLKKDI